MRRHRGFPTHESRSGGGGAELPRVDVNPISHLVTATRAFMDGTVAGLELGVALGTAALLTAVFAPLTTYLYRRK